MCNVLSIADVGHVASCEKTSQAYEETCKFAVCVCMYVCEVCLRMCAHLFFCLCAAAFSFHVPERGLWIFVVFFGQNPGENNHPPRNWKTKKHRGNQNLPGCLRRLRGNWPISQRTPLKNRCELKCEVCASGSGSAKFRFPAQPIQVGIQREKERERESEIDIEREREWERERERETNKLSDSEDPWNYIGYFGSQHFPICNAFFYMGNFLEYNM